MTLAVISTDIYYFFKYLVKELLMSRFVNRTKQNECHNLDGLYFSSTNNCIFEATVELNSVIVRYLDKQEELIVFSFSEFNLATELKIYKPLAIYNA